MWIEAKSLFPSSSRACRTVEFNYFLTKEKGKETRWARRSFNRPSQRAFPSIKNLSWWRRRSNCHLMPKTRCNSVWFTIRLKTRMWRSHRVVSWCRDLRALRQGKKLEEIVPATNGRRKWQWWSHDPNGENIIMTSFRFEKCVSWNVSRKKLALCSRKDVLRGEITDWRWSTLVDAE